MTVRDQLKMDRMNPVARQIIRETGLKPEHVQELMKPPRTMKEGAVAAYVTAKEWHYRYYPGLKEMVYGE